MSERTGILDPRHFGHDHDVLAQSKFASYEPADEIGEGAALKTRPGARPSRPCLLPSPRQSTLRRSPSPSKTIPRGQSARGNGDEDAESPVVADPAVELEGNEARAVAYP